MRNFAAWVLALIAIATLLQSCASATVDVTKTGKGFYEPTVPDEVQILRTKPDRPYEELGTVTASGFAADETAKMHNAIRAKAASLGANAAILSEEGLTPGGFGAMNRWCTGVAIRLK